MKLKKSFYCISDKNNKPDFRYLFEDPRDAQRKIKQIKNSTQGETLFLGNRQRDFFVDGVRRNFISPFKRVCLKRGCWTGLKVTKVKLLENIAPEKVFQRTVKSSANQLVFSKQRQREFTFYNPDIKLPVVPNPFLSFDWESSFLRTKAFMGAFASLCLVTITSVFFIYQHSSQEITKNLIDQQNQLTQKAISTQTKVLGQKDEKLAQQFNSEMNKFVLETLDRFENIKQEELGNEIRRIVAGSPMEQMVPYIEKQDRIVAAFLVGIAKKESNFGRRVPVLNGQDCYNYWGYRGIRKRMGSGGHTCFDSPEDAVETVARRIKELVQAKIDTPQEMVIWKCGSSCKKHSSYSVQKWINDVNIYFSEINKPQNAS